MTTLRTLLASFLFVCSASADVTLFPVQDRDVYQGTGTPTTTPETLGVSSSAAMGGGHSQKSLIQFDVRPATVGMAAGEIGSAKLRLYVMRPEVFPRGFDIGGTIRLFYQKSAWSETRLYWASFDPGEQVATLTMTADRSLGDSANTWVYPIGVWVEVDVTPAVVRWLDGSAANHGLVLAPDETNSPYLSSAFADSMTGFKPQLVIKKKAAELKLTRFQLDGAEAVIEWSAAAGTTYLVRESADLEHWEVRATVTATGDSGSARVVRTEFPGKRGFYQVVVAE